MIRGWIKKLFPWLPGFIATVTGQAPESPDSRLIDEIRSERLTYLTKEKMQAIASICRGIERQGLPGIFIETGCALGGSSILIALVKDSERVLKVYDVFDTIPPPTADDPEDVHERYAVISSGESAGIGGDEYYGYRDNLIALVGDNMKRFGVEPAISGVELIRGLVQETLEVVDPVAFAHIDVDWYEPVRTCLERIYPRLVPGGSIVLDDYHDWGGCKLATDKFLETLSGKFHTDDSAGSMRIIKIAD